MTYTIHTTVSTLNHNQFVNYCKFMQNVAKFTNSNEHIVCIHHIVTVNDKIDSVTIELAFTHDIDATNTEVFVYNNNGSARHTFDEMTDHECDLLEN